MFKVLGLSFRKSAEVRTEASAPPALGRAELQNLFQDDFAAHAMIVKSRKAARVCSAVSGRESVDFLLRRAAGSGLENANRKARSWPLCHGPA